MNLGNAVGAFDPDLGEFLVAVYVTGDLDPLTERSEIAQYRNSGWRIYEMPRERLADLAENPAGMNVFLAWLLGAIGGVPRAYVTE